MPKQRWLGHEWVSEPAFSIGDAVVHCYDGLNDDELSPKKWHKHWYRGIIIGSYYNRNTRPLRGWYITGWIYIVEIDSASAGDGIQTWSDVCEEFPEYDLKPSRQLARVIAARCQSK